jgi:hypothetical protein
VSEANVELEHLGDVVNHQLRSHGSVRGNVKLEWRKENGIYVDAAYLIRELHSVRQENTLPGLHLVPLEGFAHLNPLFIVSISMASKMSRCLFGPLHHPDRRHTHRRAPREPPRYNPKNRAIAETREAQTQGRW